MGALGTIFKGLVKGLRNRDHPDYSFIKIGQNTEKGHGDLRRLASSLSVFRERPSDNNDEKPLKF